MTNVIILMKYRLKIKRRTVLNVTALSPLESLPVLVVVLSFVNLEIFGIIKASYQKCYASYLHHLLAKYFPRVKKLGGRHQVRDRETIQGVKAIQKNWIISPRSVGDDHFYRPETKSMTFRIWSNLSWANGYKVKWYSWHSLEGLRWHCTWKCNNS